MKTCGEISEALSAFVDGEATREEIEAVEGHLLSCGACRAREREMQKARALLAGLEAAVPDDFRDRVFERLEAQDLLPKRRSLAVLSLRWLALPAAAAAAVAFFVWSAKDGSLRFTRLTAPFVQVARGPATAAPAAGKPRGTEAATPSVWSSDGAGLPGSGAGESRGPSEAGRQVLAQYAGSGGGAVTPAAGLSAEEREIVALLEVFENPQVFEEPSEVDELEIFADGQKERG